MLKQKEKLMFVLLLFSCILLSMSFISANENITNNDSHNIDYNDSIDNSINKSFTDLNNLVNNDLNKSEIILDNNYVYQGHEHENITNCIFINRSVTIDGQGHFIDANWSSRIFHINANNVILKNIIFKKSESRDAGALYCNGMNITIINSTFINNWIFDSDGAAINYKYDGMIINSTFINNYVYNISSADNNAFAFNIHNESILYGLNCEEVQDIISFEKNYNVTIINSNFTNAVALPIIFEYRYLAGPVYPNISYIDNTIDKNNFSKFSDNKIKKVSLKFIAKNKVLNKKTKTKKYSVILKNKNKSMKNTWVTLKVKNMVFKAKTNKKGEAIFKINKLNKKGKYKATLLFKGDDIYNEVSKQVKITIK